MNQPSEDSDLNKGLEHIINPPQQIITERVRDISRWLLDEFGVCTVMTCQRRYSVLFLSQVSSEEIICVWGAWSCGRIWLDNTGHAWFSFKKPE